MSMRWEGGCEVKMKGKIKKKKRKVIMNWTEGSVDQRMNDKEYVVMVQGDCIQHGYLTVPDYSIHHMN